MQYRRLGRTGLEVSVVGFGTAQFRLIPEQRAIDALKCGFSLGVNLVHTSPDYEGADDLVAQAVAESGKNIIVCHQGYGDRAHIEWLFETACRKFKKERLELFGIACVDDRELARRKRMGSRRPYRISSTKEARRARKRHFLYYSRKSLLYTPDCGIRCL